MMKTSDSMNKSEKERQQRGQIYASEILIQFFFFMKTMFIFFFVVRLIQIQFEHKLKLFACGRTFI